MPKLKIYGERNSGTTFLSRLLWLNFENRQLPGTVLARDVPFRTRLLAIRKNWREPIADAYFACTYHSNLGWKHAMAPDSLYLDVARKDVAFITVTKNPYSWLLSTFNRPYHAKQKYESLQSFLAAPWQVVHRERYTRPAFQNPVHLWCEKNRSYYRLKKDAARSVNLRYEDLLANPVAALDQIGKQFGLKRRTRAWRVIQKSTNNSDGSLTSYQKYYLHEEWKQRLDRSLISIINRDLDQDLVEALGYQTLV
jgi:hypothetical protein